MSIIRPNWTIAIFSARETVATLLRCIHATVAACEGGNATIEVLVNGNRSLADATQHSIDTMTVPDGITVRLWFITFGDKAHAWNQYLHDIWEGSDTTYFIDGYAEVQSDALRLIHDGLAVHQDALGATGVPTCGRTAATLRASLLADGGIHGNLYALRGSTMKALREAGFRLPLGIYRTDPLIGAVLMYRLDPANNKWDSKRVLVQDGATWHVDPVVWWHRKHLVANIKRKIRQSQGTLENLAAREHLTLKRLAPAALPETVNEFVANWLSADTGRASKLFLRQPLAYYAARQLEKPRDWRNTDKAPERLAATGA
jgi:hypothetical protein